MVTAEWNGNSEPDLQALKTRLHGRLVDTIDLGRASTLPQNEFRQQILGVTRHLAGSLDDRLGEADRESLCQQVTDEVGGFGPLDPLMNDESVTGILVSRFDRVVVERAGELQESSARFVDADHLLRFVQTVAGRAGRRIDERCPIVDARLPDGSRLTAVIPPLAIGGPTISIRRLPPQPLPMEALIRSGSLAPAMADFLILAVRGRMNIIVSGGAGAGKTTLLNSISHFIPDGQRVVTIEEMAELQFPQQDLISLEARLTGADGTGEVTQRDLLRNSLRMRPDRFVIGEARGAEVLDMLQAMNGGQRGSMSTVHANSVQETLERLELLVALSGTRVPQSAARQFVNSAVDIIVHATRLNSGEHKVTRIAEVVRQQNEETAVRDIFVYRSGGAGQEQSGFFATGYEPLSLGRLAQTGVDIDPFRPLFVPRQLQPATSAQP